MSYSQVLFIRCDQQIFFYYDGLSGIGYYVCQNNQQSVTQMWLI